jgi:hypothetical protein
MDSVPSKKLAHDSFASLLTEIKQKHREYAQKAATNSDYYTQVMFACRIKLNTKFCKILY